MYTCMVASFNTIRHGPFSNLVYTVPEYEGNLLKYVMCSVVLVHQITGLSIISNIHQLSASNYFTVLN